MTNEQIKKLKFKLPETKINGFNLINNIYEGEIQLTVDTCKVGVRVLTRAGSHFKIEKIFQNKNRKYDLTVEVGNGKFGCTYGSYKGIFPSLMVP